MSEETSASPETFDSDEYYIIPEEAVELLPEEWRVHYQAAINDGRAALKSVDKELSTLSRISRSLTMLTSLKHAQRRLAEYRFEANIDSILELDMITTAFVVTYAKLQKGEIGSGFSRDALPSHLREAHDKILELRNKRFAHGTDHESFSDALEFSLIDGRFELNMKFSLGYYVGGQVEWHEIVRFLESLFFERMETLMRKLNQKSGHEWVWPQGPAPENEKAERSGAFIVGRVTRATPSENSETSA